MQCAFRRGWLADWLAGFGKWSVPQAVSRKEGGWVLPKACENYVSAK